MADTKHLHAAPPVEGDGVNYRGIVWFVVILTATTVTCQIIVWAGFVLMERIHVTNAGIARAPLSAPAASPSIGKGDQAGRMLTGLESAPRMAVGTSPPGLLVSEPSVLSEFRKREDASLGSYGWIDKTSGVVRIPIERAKSLVLERGLPTRSAGARTGGAAAPAAAPSTPKPAAPASAPRGR